jgi:hypothetical protein
MSAWNICADLCLTLSDYEDLRRCTPIPEDVQKQYTYMNTAAPCRICPNDNCEVVGNYDRSGRVTLSCFAETVTAKCMNYCLKGDPQSTNPYSGSYRVPVPDWYRTVNNCYIRASSVQAGKIFDFCSILEYRLIYERTPNTG